MMVNMAGTARQIHLGRQLRRLRIEAGLSLDAISDRIERSRSTVGHWERGRSSPAAAEMKILLALYGVSEEYGEHLHQLRREGGQRGWWNSYKLPSHLAPFIEFETDASEVFHFELGLVPGLMQIPDYARSIHEVGRLNPSEKDRQDWIDVRMRRQERLCAGGGLTFHTVIAEEALHRIVGSREVMARQIKHLEDLSHLPSVNLQVLPYSAGAHAGSVGPITVLRFPDASHGDIAFTDTPLGGNVIDDVRDVAELSRLFAEIKAQALPATESKSLLGRVRDDHHSQS